MKWVWACVFMCCVCMNFSLASEKTQHINVAPDDPCLCLTFFSDYISRVRCSLEFNLQILNFFFFFKLISIRQVLGLTLNLLSTDKICLLTVNCFHSNLVAWQDLWSSQNRDTILTMVMKSRQRKELDGLSQLLWITLCRHRHALLWHWEKKVDLKKKQNFLTCFS